MDQDGCAAACDRRDFLRQGAALVAGLAALGLVADDAGALPVTVAPALERTAGTASYPIPAADGVVIDDKRDVVLVRTKGTVIAFLTVCPHKGTTPVDWSAARGQFVCPKHKSRFEATGQRVEGSKADRALDRYAITRSGATVVVNLDRVIEQDKDPAAWAAAQFTV
jgi:nitrite reductase/ring-hydroxylating ferredoxin subunit